MVNDPIMTLSEVAQYLKLAEKTVLRMVHRNEIPCAKVGNQWRFMRPMINDWLLSKMRVVPRNDLARLVEQNERLLPLSRLVLPEYVILGIRPDTKENVLAQMVRPLKEKGIVADDENFLAGLIRREQIVSTAMGNGVALPHLRDPRKNPIPGPAVIVGICPDGTDFDSADGEKTYLLFVLSTDSEVVHLRLMARLAALLKDSRLVQRLADAGSPEDAIAALMAAEQTDLWRMEESHEGF